jgi:S-formylglutathione hydrolase FrmB
MIDKFILVAVDMNTSLGSSWCVNSATGNWEDFVIQELKPYIDANFRTLPKRESQGVAGEFTGGSAPSVSACATRMFSAPCMRCIR